MADPDKYFREANELDFMINEHQLSHPVRRKIFEEYVKIVPVPTGSVLDVGCNIGLDYDIWWRCGYARYTGVDFQEKYLRAAKMRCGLTVDFRQMDARHLDFPDNLYDVAYTKDVIEHIAPDDVVKVINELWRVSKKAIMISFFHPPVAKHDNEIIQVNDAGFWDNTYYQARIGDILTGLIPNPVRGYQIPIEFPESVLYVVMKV